MNHCYRTAAGAAVASLFATQPCFAQAPAQSTAQPLTRAAYLATMDAEYAKLDANHDGVATRTELAARQGTVRAEAADQQARALFGTIDADHNGQVSVSEFVKAVAKPQPADVGAMMKRLDTNGDQKVSVVEYRVVTLSGFDRLDVDKDGQLTIAEQRASGLRK